MHKEAVRECRFYGCRKEERKRRMGLLTFKGGIHPDDGKRFSKGSAGPPRLLPEGRAGVSAVSAYRRPGESMWYKKGDRVLKGELIAAAGGFVSAPVHASVSGTVKGLEQSASALPEQRVECIVVENDGEYEESCIRGACKAAG